MRQLLACVILITSLPLSSPARAAGAFPLTPHAALAIQPPQEPTPAPSPAPSATPPPDPVLEQAQRDAKLADELKKKAVSDKERAEAEAARLKALVQPLGAPANITVPTGSVTTDAAGWVESQMLAQEAARQITNRLTRALCTEPITPGATAEGNADKVRTLVMYNASDLTGVELYGSISGQLQNLHDELTTKNNEAEHALEATDPTAAPSPSPSRDSGTADFAPTLAFAAPGVATGLIKSVAELINLFRTDTEFQNRAITLNDDLIVSHIVRNFNSGVTGVNCDDTIRVYHPALYAPRLLDSSETSPIIGLLNDVEMAKIEAAGNVEKIDARIKELRDLSAAFKSREEKSNELAGKRREKAGKEEALAKCKKESKPAECRKKLRAEIKALDEEIAGLVKDITKLDDDLKAVKADPKNFKGWIDRLTELRAKTQSLVNATNLISAKLNAPDEASRLTALAQLIRAERLRDILKEDGAYTLHVRVTANGTTKIKKNLFVDAKIRHSAGADLSYRLIEGGGVIAQGDELKCYVEYQSARNVQEMVSGTGRRKVQCRFPGDSVEAESEEGSDKAASRRKPRKSYAGQ